MTSPRQERWQCPDCNSAGWYTPSALHILDPRRDHGRPDGRRCLAVWGAAESVHVANRRDGRSALGWFALDRSSLSFLRPDERALFCNVPLALHLPVALPLSEVLSHLPAEPTP